MYRKAFSLGGINVQGLKNYVPDLTIWGIATGAALMAFTDGIPLFTSTLHSKMPYFGQHWVEEKDPEDIPI